jgi:flagellar basal-body rod protein FlgF
MIYGMYLSATGLITASHQQDVIANNLANAETGGFKRQLEIQTQRQVESKVAQSLGQGNSLLDNIGGGQLTGPTYTDFTAGDLEDTANNFDTAITGQGFFAVKDGDQTRLTRNGSLMIDKQGHLITTAGQQVLDSKRQPITLSGFAQSQLRIETDGSIKSGRDTIAQIGLFQPDNPQSLHAVGRNMYGFGTDTKLNPADARLQHNMLEKANVDPTTELTRLMESQRLLEANANMIRYQDQSLSRAVNDVGKIS